MDLPFSYPFLILVIEDEIESSSLLSESRILSVELLDHILVPEEGLEPSREDDSQ